jgi:beta-glucosidase
VANSWDPALAEEMGEALGSEAHDLDVNVLLGPGLNIKRNPLCGRNFEYYSEDPIVAGRMAAGLIRGIQSNGISACPKHFAVNSQELRRQASNSVVDERTMRELYLTGFEIAVREAKPLTIMTSYNEINGVYAHENKHLLQEILRDEWGFDGMVVSDWGGSNSAVAAVKAGGSLEMPSPGFTPCVSWKARSRRELCLKPISTRVPQKSQKSRQRPSWSVLDVTICSKTISQQRITTWHARWPKAPVCC